jgi:cytochrome c oxidase assembly protein Cox11
LPEDVRTVSLSYTFYQAQGEDAGKTTALESGGLDSIL